MLQLAIIAQELVPRTSLWIFHEIMTAPEVASHDYNSTGDDFQIQS